MAPRKTKPKSEKSSRISDSDLNAAVSVIKAEYYQDVRGLGDDLKSRIKDGEITDAEDFRERLQEDVDGSARVIYTFQSKLGLLSSDNEDAYMDDFGEVPVEGGSINWAAMMAMAMMRDVEEYLGDIDDLFQSDEDDEG